MNKYIIKKALFSAFLLAGVVFAGCQKDDGPIRKEFLDLIDAIPAISTAIDPSGSPAIDVLNPDNFSGVFTVSEFFDGPGAESPEKVDVVISKNGGKGSAVKLFKENLTTFPSTFTITAAELVAFFGPIEVDDYFDVSTDIYTKNGKKFEAFPVGGVSTSPGPIAVPGFSHAVRYAAICAYDPAIYEGEFEIIADASYSQATGETVTLTRVSENSFSFQYPAFALIGPSGHEIVVSINTNNNTASVARSGSLGGAWAWSTSYSGPAVASTGAATASFVLPCDESFTLNLNYLVDAGSFGAFAMTVKKKQ